MAAGGSYHDQILERLAGELDPKAFERCMGDLLRADFPGLVPVVGGSDGGFDAAIPDGEGEPFPLACTTSSRFSDIKRNLLKSLKSAQKKPWCRNRIALATSAELTPDQWHNLIDAVWQQGATLTRIFDRNALADRLERHPDWSMQLLGLPRKLRALSKIPASLRQAAPTALLGRERDLEWLRATDGDRLLHGQPGSGKTFLLRRIVAESEAYFMVADDSQLLQSDLLELRPRLVIVDDAHVHPDRIALLRRMREANGHRFDVVATCWPYDVEDVAQQLGGLPAQRIRALELLTRDEIVELFRQLDVATDDDQMRFLVDQAANKPGLAVVIAQSWLAGDVGDVWSGEVLRRDVVASFRQRVGPSTDEVLAAIALGGDGGISIDALVKCLGALASDVRLAAVEMREGGVLTQVAESTLSVMPSALRTALVREGFFSQGSNRSLVLLKALLAEVPCFEDAALEVVRCARTGGKVSETDLRDVVQRAHATAPHRSRRVWREAALVDASTARWVLESYPGDVADVARETIHHAPEFTISILLRAAEGASGEIRNTLGHPLRILSDWCRDGDNGEDESLERRRLLLSCVEGYASRGGEAEVAVRAGFVALDPSLAAHSRDPGLGKTFNFRWAILSGDSVARLGKLWSRLRPLVMQSLDRSWPHVSDLLWKCAHPDGIHPTRVSDGSHAALCSLGEQIARDVAPMVDGRPGITTRLAEYASALAIALELPRDETFDALFPPRSDEEPTEDDRKRIEMLAEEWSRRPSADVKRALSFYENEQHFVSHGRASLLRELCEGIAKQVEAPDQWIGDPISDGAPPVLLMPLVARCVRERPAEFFDVVDRCLGAPLPTWNWIGVDGALRIRDLPDPILHRALAVAARFPDHVETLCSRGVVPVEMLERLLDSDVMAVRAAAVVGEWLAPPRKQVREEIRPRWHAAIARTRLNDLDELGRVSSLQFWLGEILHSDPDLSLAWLRSVLPGVHPRLELDGPLGRAIDGLSRAQRIELLATLAEVQVTLDPHELSARVVGGDPEVYRVLLSARDLPDARGRHLAPLADPTRPEWPALVVEATRTGYAADDVAAASLEVADLIGDDTDRLHRCRDVFEQLQNAEDERLVAVGRAGRRLVDRELTRVTDRARRQAMRGI